MASAGSYKGIEFLTEENYFVWRTKVKNVLKAKGWFDTAIVENKPAITEVVNYNNWSKANAEALGFMIQTE